MSKKLFFLVPVLLLAGCTSSAQRMSDCEAQGVSRDACYVAEQNRQNGISAQAEAQAMRNAQALYPVAPVKHHHNSTQYAQSVHKNRDKISCDDLRHFISAGIEHTPTSDVYSQGLYQVVVYKSGKVALLKERVVQGYLH